MKSWYFDKKCVQKHQWFFDTSVEFQNLKSNWGMSFSLSYLLTFDRQLIPQISLIIGLESSGSVALSFSFFTEQLNKPFFIPINIPIEAQLLVALELWFRGIFSTSIINLPLSNKPQRQAGWITSTEIQSNINLIWQEHSGPSSQIRSVPFLFWISIRYIPACREGLKYAFMSISRQIFQFMACCAYRWKIGAPP